ncbi:DUF1998 domain-containing protein [Streptomyces sp. LUP47B]|uniref:DUF1998 domain-containing protein n=1 Tax=Streptomyces sp. LUP47B TaxID=1890286 RepID=UPI00210C80E1|nr:DUF1998 domain-containing protein [Streptomyces sp. LUP47B]
MSSPTYPVGDVVRALLSRYADPEGYVTPRVLDGVARLAGLGAREAAALRAGARVRGDAVATAAAVVTSAETAVKLTDVEEHAPEGGAEDEPFPLPDTETGRGIGDVTAAVAAALAVLEDDRFRRRPETRLLSAEAEVGLAVLLRGAHLLIRQLSFESGYTTASLRDRVYARPEQDQYGILVYTAAGDAEGTLGGLVRQGEPPRLAETLLRMTEAAAWCSADPLCAEHTGKGFGNLNRAACHACALLPETSCETGNTLVDGALVVGGQVPGCLESIVTAARSAAVDPRRGCDPHLPRPRTGTALLPRRPPLRRKSPDQRSAQQRQESPGGPTGHHARPHRNPGGPVDPVQSAPPVTGRDRTRARPGGPQHARGDRTRPAR